MRAGWYRARFSVSMLLGGLAALLLMTPLAMAAGGSHSDPRGDGTAPGIPVRIGGHGWYYRDTDIQVTADFTGTTTADVLAALRGCITLADYAYAYGAVGSYGTTERALIAAIVTELRSQGQNNSDLSSRVAHDV